MFGLEISSVPVILPTLERYCDAAFTRTLQWIMNAYTIACTTVLMATGTLADRFGRKRVFVISLVAVRRRLADVRLARKRGGADRRPLPAGHGRRRDADLPIAVLSHQFPGRPRARPAFGAWGIVLASVSASARSLAA